MLARQSDRPKTAPSALAVEPQAAGQTVASPPEVVPALPVPRLIKFSGTLKDSSGQPRTGTVGLTFSIYKDQEGGSTLWMETHNVELDAQGQYSVLLGSRQSEGIPLELFVTGESRWLGVKVELPGEVEQARVLLVSVPYALKASDADTLGGKPASAYALAPGAGSAGETQSGSGATGTGQTGSANASAIVRTAINGSGMLNQVAKFTPDGMTIGSSAISEVNGNVGVGVSNPMQSLVIAVPPGRTAMNMSNLVDQDMLITVSSPGAADKVSFIGPSTSTNLALGVAGGEKVRITNSGNVGIGVSSPAQRLTIAAPVGGPIINASNLADQDMFITLSAPGAADKHAFFGPGTNTNLTLGVNSTEMIRITNAGNVGVGTPTPGQKLSVAGTIESTAGGFKFPDGTMQSTAASAGPGTGTVTSVGSGLGLKGGPITSSGALMIDTSVVPQLGATSNTFTGSITAGSFSGNGTGLSNVTAANSAMLGGMLPIAFATTGVNTFSGNQTITGNLALSGSLALPNTTSATVGVVSLGGTPFLQNFGTNNTFVGASAGNMSMTGSGNNTAVGAAALNSNTSGSANSAFGPFALFSNTTGINNAAFGYGALRSNAPVVAGDAQDNSAFGFAALFSNTTAFDNSAFGSGALQANTTGDGNSALGSGALFSNTTGADNSAFGDVALRNLVSGSSNIAIGAGAGNNLTASENGNIYIGHAGVAGESNTIRIGSAQAATFLAGNVSIPGTLTMGGTVSFASGQVFPGTTGLASTNIFTAQDTFAGLPTGSSVSQGSLFINPATAGAGQTLLGAAVGGTQQMLLDTSGDLTLAGSLALPNTSSATVGVISLGGAPFLSNFGTRNTFVGVSGNTNMTGSFNTAVGNTAFAADTTGTGNSALGFGALAFNTSGSNNSAFGNQALNQNTTGMNNSAFGTIALFHNVSGARNSAFGYAALNANAEVDNSAFGYSALSSNTTGSSNSAFGSSALSANTTASNNSAFGFQALQLDTIGNNNSAFGQGALQSTTMGTLNSAFGSGALMANTIGANNVAFGYNALNQLTGGNNNIALGFEGGFNLTGSESNNIDIGNGGLAGESNTIRIGTPTTHTATFLSGNVTIPGTLAMGGVVTFTAGQSFPGSGTITGVTAGTGLGGGGTSGVVALNNTGVLSLAASAPLGITSGQNPTVSLGVVPIANGGTGSSTQNFVDLTSTQAIGGNKTFSNTITGSANLALPNTVSGGTAGVITLGGTPFLQNLGINNTFVGASAGNFSLSGGANTGVGNGALFSDTSGDLNSAFGAGALGFNTMGRQNSAFGEAALGSNIAASGNSAFGYQALTANTAGAGNAAFGFLALSSNTSACCNAAFGNGALQSNTTKVAGDGQNNSAFGDETLNANTTGADNSAFGYRALSLNTIGNMNAAFGEFALQFLTSGSSNIAIGNGAGSNLTGAESNNIYIGHAGLAGESNIIRIGDPAVQSGAAFIAGIDGVTIGGGTAVFVNNQGRLGTATSSRRFKHQIADMGAESDLLMKLRPVAFYYKPELDESQTRQYGLVAEEVAQIAPQLVIFDKDGQAQTVRYHFVNAMLLNEVQKQRHTIEQQQAQIQELAARLARLEALIPSKP